MFFLLDLLCGLAQSTIFKINLELTAKGLHHGKNFDMVEDELDIYMDYEVNQNDSFKEFINILKTRGFGKAIVWIICFSEEDNPWGTVWFNSPR